jgi:hypothetical protein
LIHTIQTTDKQNDWRLFEMSDAVKIQIMPNGPAIVEGAFEVTNAAGENLADGKSRVALCRCGASNKKPFCDGTHGKVGFEG